MQRNEVKQILENIPTGTTLRLVYQEANPGMPLLLLVMVKRGVIKLANPNDEVTIRVVQQTGNWGHPDAKTYEVVTTETFDQDLFIKLTLEWIESLEIVPADEE